MAINILETDIEGVYTIEGQYDENNFDIMINGKWGDDIEDEKGDSFFWEGDTKDNNPFDSMLRGYAESICHNLTDELREMIDSHHYEKAMEKLGIKSMMMGYNDNFGNSIAFTDYCFNTDLDNTEYLIAKNTDSKLCKENATTYNKSVSLKEGINDLIKHQINIGKSLPDIGKELKEAYNEAMLGLGKAHVAGKQ